MDEVKKVEPQDLSHANSDEQLDDTALDDAKLDDAELDDAELDGITGGGKRYDRMFELLSNFIG